MKDSKTVVGVDIAKRVFQLHWIDMETGEIVSLQLRRQKLTAAVATMGDARAFKSGREFGAWLGLVPRQTGTGGRIRLLGISKRGDTYLPTLLIHGARSVLTHAKEPEPWLTQLRQRRPLNVAVVALANRIARTIWALLAHERTYQKGFVSQPA